MAVKRFVLPAALVALLAMAFGATTPHAFARRATSTPTPSPTPAPLPTATPEPASIAIPQLQARLKANPNDQDAMTELAGEYLSINRPDLTLALTRHLLDAGDKTAQVYFIDGYAQQALGQLAAAIEDLEQASTLDPTNVEVLGNLANLYLAVDQPMDAERIAKRAVTFNKTNPDAYMTLGSVYAAESHYDDARIQFEQAFSLDKTSAKPLYSIAQTYVAQNNVPMALQTIERALAVDPNSVDALVFKAGLYARQHDVVRAAEAYDDASVAAPTDEQKVAIEVQKGEFFSNEHLDSQAQGVYQQLLTQYPNVALTYVGYGAYLASERHDMSGALTQWQKALKIDPDDTDALRDMGQYAMQHNRGSDAIGYLKHLTTVEPTAENYALLAEAYNMTRQYAQQREACKDSFAIKRTPETLGCIGGADFELHDYREAGEIFQALDLYAKGYLDRDPGLLYVAARTYTTLHQRDRAIDAYRRLLALTPRGSAEYKKLQKALSDLNRGH
jgi:tetratricopeptide (TPR) repeat protein